VLHEIEGPRLTPGEHVLAGRLDRAGTLTLEVDRAAVATPVVGKLLARLPTDGLDVGRDLGGAVGPYSSPYSYPGKIKRVVIEIGGR
jgi:hypothetical protein